MELDIPLASGFKGPTPTESLDEHDLEAQQASVGNAIEIQGDHRQYLWLDQLASALIALLIGTLLGAYYGLHYPMASIRLIEIAPICLIYALSTILAIEICETQWAAVQEASGVKKLVRGISPIIPYLGCLMVSPRDGALLCATAMAFTWVLLLDVLPSPLSRADCFRPFKAAFRVWAAATMALFVAKKVLL